MLVLPAAHAPVRGASRICPTTWIAGCPRCRGHLLELCERAGFAPRIGFETDNYVAVEGLVAQGIGVATLPRMALDSFPMLPGIATAPLPLAEATSARRHGAGAERCRRSPPR
jgi:DNA-binding transcriptional LysR family regulator